MIVGVLRYESKYYSRLSRGMYSFLLLFQVRYEVMARALLGKSIEGVPACRTQSSTAAGCAGPAYTHIHIPTLWYHTIPTLHTLPSTSCPLSSGSSSESCCCGAAIPYTLSCFLPAIVCVCMYCSATILPVALPTHSFLHSFILSFSLVLP